MIFFRIASGLVYLGVSMNMDALVGDIYTNIIIGSFLEVPIILLAIIIVFKLGRKRPLIGCYIIMALTSFCAILMEAVPGELNCSFPLYSQF